MDHLVRNRRLREFAGKSSQHIGEIQRVEPSVDVHSRVVFAVAKAPRHRQLVGQMIGKLPEAREFIRPRVAAELIEGRVGGQPRSEEHTYELQSLMRTSYAAVCLTK